MVSDPGWHSIFSAWPHLVDEVLGGAVGVALVLGLSLALRKRAAAVAAIEAAEAQKAAE
jgi:hypothetical protein